jgi:dienelactone hydrolase
VTFHNGAITLAGTFMRPSGSAPYPAVVLLHGSGPEARNLEMAEWWASQGVAALTYDKRGVGQSTGDFGAIPFQDLSLDGLAGVAWLKARDDIDVSRIGVWGLSQGGWLGPLAATRSTDIHFVVAVSGPGVSPGEQMVFYYENQLRAAGVSEPEIARVTAIRRVAWTAAFTRQDIAGARTRVAAARAATSDPNVKEQFDALTRTLSGKSIWISQEMNYDPIATLRRLTVPALFLFAGDDALVPVPASIDAIRRVLTETHHPDFQIELVPKANHGMYVVDATGSRQLSAEYLADMQAWVRAHVTH